jgi:hypothetical protein
MRVNNSTTAVLAWVFCLLSLSVCFAEEIVPINTILASAASLSQHLVTFQGTVKEIEALPPFPTPGCLSVDRYRVRIEDDTGAIDAIVCGSLNYPTRISKDENVRVRAVISVLAGNTLPPPVLAIVKSIAQITGPQD